MLKPSEQHKVAYLGPQASYTHQAALKLFPDTAAVTLVPQTSIAAVFTAVQNGSTARGVVPFENSSNGAVLPTLDLLASLDAQHPDVGIVGEQYVDVHHCLLGRRSGPRPPPSAIPEGGDQRVAVAAASDADLRRIKTIYSHPQVWGQVRRSLEEECLAGAERVDVSSTSAAAARVADQSSAAGEEAAIASRLAAEVYGLDVLRGEMEDRADNQTRFFVLARRGGREDATSAPLLPAAIEAAPAASTTTTTTGLATGGPRAGRSGKGPTKKTLLHFRVNSHSDPGALADALAVFKKYGLSLTSMYTRPDPRPGAAAAAGGERWRYIFFVEFGCDSTGPAAGEGDNDGDDDDDDDERVRLALDELRGVSRQLTVVGRWSVTR